MREIAGSENPHADKQAAEVNRERLQSEQEGTLRGGGQGPLDRKSTRLNSSHGYISYAVFCLKKKNTNIWNFQRSVSGSRNPTSTGCLQSPRAASPVMATIRPARAAAARAFRSSDTRTESIKS